MIEYPRYTTLPDEYIKAKIVEFLKEDAPNGDVTTLGTIPENNNAKAIIEAEGELIMAGVPVIQAFFGNEYDSGILVNDGDVLNNGDIICSVYGNSRNILTKERSLLNLLQRLCGISTLTAKYVAIAKPYGVKILDTRKTVPGLRLFDKYAVTCGGGYNHRLDLSSAVLIKDNHLKAAGGIKQAVSVIKKIYPDLPIELEVDESEQIEEGMRSGVDGFLLDNMSPGKTKYVVEKVRSFPGGNDIFIESSGGINLDTLPGYVNTGINAVSIGALTHSVKAADIHMEFE